MGGCRAATGAFSTHAKSFTNTAAIFASRPRPVRARRCTLRCRLFNVRKHAAVQSRAVSFERVKASYYYNLKIGVPGLLSRRLWCVLASLAVSGGLAVAQSNQSVTPVIEEPVSWLDAIWNLPVFRWFS